MIRISDLSASLDLAPSAYSALAAKALRLPARDILSCRLYRRSVDARKRDDVHFTLSLDVAVRGDEAAILRRAPRVKAEIIQPAAPVVVPSLSLGDSPRPIVVGCGPAGLFAALTACAQPGLAPDGPRARQDVDERAPRDVDGLLRAAARSTPESNVQFGEGGAGAFSDGKLNSGIKDPRCRACAGNARPLAGAPEEILCRGQARTWARIKSAPAVVAPSAQRDPRAGRRSAALKRS